MMFWGVMVWVVLAVVVVGGLTGVGFLVWHVATAEDRQRQADARRFEQWQRMQHLAQMPQPHTHQDPPTRQ